MPRKIPGFGASPKEHWVRPTRNGNRKFTIFAIQLLTKIKTVADPFESSPLSLFLSFPFPFPRIRPRWRQMPNLDAYVIQ